jgi:hypothetical protein
MKRKIVKITVLAILLLSASLAQAVPITIEITGNVTNFSDGTGLLDTIHVDSIFSGTYTYDSSTVDSGGGHHLHSSPYGISLSLGGYEFKTASTHVDQFDMWILNDDEGNGVKDFYLVRSHENALLPNGIAVSLIRWDLNDSTHTALSSNVLPTTAPSLTSWDYNYVEIYGGNSQGGFYIGGTVTQAVPEPLTGVLMVMGALFFRRRQ